MKILGVLKNPILVGLFVFAVSSKAFVLVSPTYKLADPSNTVVNIASGGCQANGMTNDELLNAIRTSLNRYWNTVGESRLNLKVGTEVSRDLNDLALPGEINVGCAPMGMSGPSGVAYPSEANGSARVVLNGTTLVPGGYLPEGLIGVLAHELGHAIGLGHSADPASIMTYESNGWGASPTYLSQDDKDGVTYLYPNKGIAGGLIGGCSAVASTEGKQSPYRLTFALEMLLMLSLALALQAASRKFKSLR